MNIGRPRNGEERPGLAKITFRVDEETLTKLRELEKQEGPNVRGRRSNLLRKLIQTAHEKLAPDGR